MSGGPSVSREDGRRLSGTGVAGYATGRPGYPPEALDAVQERCGLRPGRRRSRSAPAAARRRWSLSRALYGTLSSIIALRDGERERLLGDVARVVDDELGGLVRRRCVTVLSTARRAGRR